MMLVSPDLECRPPDGRTRVSVCFAPLHYADQQTSLFQAGKELMDFDGYGSFLVASCSQKSG